MTDKDKSCFRDGDREAGDPDARTLARRMGDITERPEEHDHHDAAGFNACCTVGGNFYMTLAELHAIHCGNYGRNGGAACDTVEGPCACGAWHALEPAGRGKFRRT